jgi:glycine cleavage system H protein
LLLSPPGLSLPLSRTVEPPKMPTPSDVRFTESHEWADLDGDVVTIGITKYAADELTDITYVEMKPVRTTVLPGDSVGEVESVKATNDVYSPVGGEVVEVNQAAADEPSLLNTDPFGTGWLIKIRTADPSPLDGLMDQATYAKKYPTGG